MALSRQTVANLKRPGFDPKVMLRGAYTLSEATGGAPTVVIVATGSEVEVAVGAKPLLEAAGQRVRVVSAPCWDAFERQDAGYRDSVLPKGARRVVIEIGRTEPWRGVVGPDGLVIGWDDFGASANNKDIQKHFGFMPDQVAGRIKTWLG
jgi:transketolase